MNTGQSLRRRLASSIRPDGLTPYGSDENSLNVLSMSGGTGYGGGGGGNTADYPSPVFTGASSPVISEQDSFERHSMRLEWTNDSQAEANNWPSEIDDSTDVQTDDG
ncbi:unnamed protein product [Trichobilharzia regenti]|nr:unnamed protein product [Trichobilharzia regenti]